MANIVINYQNAQVTSSNSSIRVTGGSFAVQANAGLSVEGAFDFAALAMTAGTITFDTNPGATLSGTVSVPVVPSGGDPAIEVSNVSGTVMVNWPTNTGPETQRLLSGVPLTLSGYAG